VGDPYIFFEPTMRAMMTGGTTVHADTTGLETVPAHGLRVSLPVLQFSSPIAPRATD
jgi:hypothetical protein